MFDPNQPRVLVHVTKPVHVPAKLYPDGSLYLPRKRTEVTVVLALNEADEARLVKEHGWPADEVVRGGAGTNFKLVFDSETLPPLTHLK